VFKLYDKFRSVAGENVHAKFYIDGMTPPNCRSRKLKSNMNPKLSKTNCIRFKRDSTLLQK